MQLFYVPNISDSEITLDETESKHAIKVLRLSVGDSVQLIDGIGGFYEAEISDAHPKKCKLAIVSSNQEFGKKDFHLHIAIAPTKNRIATRATVASKLAFETPLSLISPETILAIYIPIASIIIPPTILPPIIAIV